MAQKILLCVYDATFSLFIPVIGYLDCEKCCKKYWYASVYVTCWLGVFWLILSYHVTGPYCRSVFSILRNYHTSFHHSWTGWHSHEQCLSFLFPTPTPEFLIFILLMTSILDGATWNLNVVFIYISLMSYEVEQFLTSLLDVCISSENILFMSSTHLLTELFEISFHVLVLCMF